MITQKKLVRISYLNQQILMNVLTKFSQEVVDYNKSLEFTRGELHNGLAGVKNDIKKVQAGQTEIEDDHLVSNFVMEKLEDRCPQNNIQIDDIPKTSSETWESCKEEVMKIIKSKFDITDDIEIDRCHHMGKFQRNKSQPQTVLFKFLCFKNKHKVLQNVKKLKNRNLHL